MKIYNKIQSVNAIKRLKLNQFAEKLITSQGKEREADVLQFVKDFPVEWYTLRDKAAGGVKRTMLLSQIRF